MAPVSLPAGVALPSLSPYGTLTGRLFLYAQGRAAFESPVNPVPATTAAKKCILLGGLSDGLLPCPYTEPLQNACHEQGYSLVQPIMSSSYTGFGHGRLSRDCSELEELLDYLLVHRSSISSSSCDPPVTNENSIDNDCSFALVGHSTGCQNIVYFLKHGRPDLVARIRVAVLQAPVSDRESMDAVGSSDDKEKQVEFLKLAKERVDSGQGEEMMPRDAFWAPMSAQRFVDLQDVLGMDDFFSSDLTDQQLGDRLGHIGSLSQSPFTMLVACSAKDEYVPKYVDTAKHLERMVNAMQGVERNKETSTDQNIIPLLLPDGNHNLSQGEHDAAVFVSKFREILQRGN